MTVGGPQGGGVLGPRLRQAGARLPNLERGSVGGASRLAHAANRRCEIRNLTRKERRLEKTRATVPFPGLLLGATDSVVDSQFLGLPRNKIA